MWRGEGGRAEQERGMGNNNGHYPPPHFTSPQIFREGRYYYYLYVLMTKPWLTGVKGPTIVTQ